MLSTKFTFQKIHIPHITGSFESLLLFNDFMPREKNENGMLIGNEEERHMMENNPSVSRDQSDEMIQMIF